MVRSTTPNETGEDKLCRAIAGGNIAVEPEIPNENGDEVVKPVRKAAKKPTAKVVVPKGKLVIVESPAKARTIGRYLGRGYEVTASMGHVRDLPKSTMGVDVDHEFAPKYIVPRDKLKTVKQLRESVKAAREIILATDPDREGEAIAWHLVAATEADPDRVKRVVFHEITEEAILEAMKSPRDIDTNLVDAQQARRILDRLVGYNVSPLLWKKVKRGLSAGRVQSAALRLVVDREQVIQDFVAVESWTVEADLKKIGVAESESFHSILVKIGGKNIAFSQGEEASKAIAGLDGAQYRVEDIRKKETQRRPSAPFTTSTLQQEASRKLKFPVSRTMQIAQQLYEGVDLGKEGSQGLITYMRTDSTNVSSTAQMAARHVIQERWGEQYLPARPPLYARRSKGAQEAHEAIRPATPERDPASVKPFLTSQQFRLYELIWQRFIASQMALAILDNTAVDIDARAPRTPNAVASLFRATGSVVRFPGFMAAYTAGRDEGDRDDLDQGGLPLLETGESLDLVRLIPEQHFTQPPPRYTEATLVKAMEEEGIGRPSTYVPTIQTLHARSYVTTEERKLHPTELGQVVNNLLAEHFPEVFDIGFTSQMESELDDIASGDREWVPVVQDFYGPFSQTLAQAEQSIQRVKLKDELAGEDCEQCGRPMLIKMGRFGKFIACSGFPKCRNAKPILEKAGIGCPTCKQGDVVARRSKKGRLFYGCSRYPECDFVSWNKPVEMPCPACGGLVTETTRRGQGKCTVCGTAVQLAKPDDAMVAGTITHGLSEGSDE